MHPIRAGISSILSYRNVYCSHQSPPEQRITQYQETVQGKLEPHQSTDRSIARDRPRRNPKPRSFLDLGDYNT